jgi:hypothetical protein
MSGIELADRQRYAAQTAWRNDGGDSAARTEWSVRGCTLPKLSLSMDECGVILADIFLAPANVESTGVISSKVR